jgi:BirA family transcriptional regulator, biotin operon repressor / biotin---[acetyl-CoA-carboxylase] ligase
MKNRILELLKKSKDDFISGQEISNDLGVSRAAIWKYINVLKEEGYEIESITRRGYRLISSPDILTNSEIKNYLTTKYIGNNIHYFKTIGSTNVKAKELALEGAFEGTVIISEEQTLGRGRLGRKWISPKYKGIWMSIILRPDINPMYASKVTHIGAAAVSKAAEKMGVKTLIKWPNDIIINNKKVCGILTEMSGEMDKINYIVMGIGINVNISEDEFDDEISEIATSFKVETKKEFVRKELTAKILNNFEELYNEFIEQGTINKTLKICRENSILLGKEARIIKNNKELKVKVLELNDEGELIVQYEDGKIEKVLSGEVSMRGLYGYI